MKVKLTKITKEKVEKLLQVRNEVEKELNLILVTIAGQHNAKDGDSLSLSEDCTTLFIGENEHNKLG